MQFNGIGGEHDAEMHHVTNCMHDHTHYKQKVEAAGLKSGNAEGSGSSQAPSEGQLSLASWLERTFGNGKRILRGFWNGSEGDQGTEGNRTAGTRALTEIAENEAEEGRGVTTGTALHNAQVAAASSAVTPRSAVPDNPYFAPIENGGRARETLWHKLKMRCRNATGQMARHLPGKFLNAQTRGSFQSRQEPPKEDLRKHSKYRQDTLEIDCVLTDDSYLLDSYDRKGEYSRLSAKK